MKFKEFLQEGSKIKAAVKAIQKIAKEVAEDSKEPMLIKTGKEAQKRGGENAVIWFAYEGELYQYFSPESDYPKFSESNMDKIVDALYKLGFEVEPNNAYSSSVYKL